MTGGKFPVCFLSLIFVCGKVPVTALCSCQYSMQALPKKHLRVLVRTFLMCCVRLFRQKSKAGLAANACRLQNALILMDPTAV